MYKIQVLCHPRKSSAIVVQGRGTGGFQVRGQAGLSYSVIPFFKNIKCGYKPNIVDLYNRTVV